MKNKTIITITFCFVALAIFAPILSGSSSSFFVFILFGCSIALCWLLFKNRTLINKIDFTVVLVTYYLVFLEHIVLSGSSVSQTALWSLLPFSIIIGIIVLFYTFFARLKNKTLQDTFSLAKFFNSDRINNARKMIVVATIFAFIFSSINILFSTSYMYGSYDKSMTILTFALLVYGFVYYLTFYVEMLSVIYEKPMDNYLISEINTYQKETSEMNMRYRESVQEQIKAERMKSELITNVSHDIRTPLTSIISYVDLLSEKKSLDKEAKEYIDVLIKKSWRLNGLIDDLLDATKLSSGNTEIALEKLDLIEIISQTEADYDEQLSENNLEIISDYQEIPTLIWAEGNNVSRVLENVYGNIIKYAMPHTRVYISVAIKENQVTLTFKNISNEQLNINPNELTERFVRADKSRSTSGNGLGLYIADSIMDLMEGQLNLSINGDLFIVNLVFKKCEKKEDEM